MNFDQLVEEIFDDYQNKHRDILADILITSAQQADKIVAKYNTSNLSPEQREQLKKMIVQREVEAFSARMVELSAGSFEAMVMGEAFKDVPVSR